LDTPSNPAKPHNIVLTGFMGTGKTSVGKIVAARLGWRFVDSDQVIVQREGMPVREIFVRRGEAYFRELESKVAGELAAQAGVVIATGGGMLVNEHNRSVMLERGLVACLNASADAIAARVGRDKNRPLLQGDWRALLESRRAAYAAIPHQVETTGKTAGQVADEVIALWQRTST
jgi:shikimate kinase